MPGRRSSCLHALFVHVLFSHLFFGPRVVHSRVVRPRVVCSRDTACGRCPASCADLGSMCLHTLSSQPSKRAAYEGFNALKPSVPARKPLGVCVASSGHSVRPGAGHARLLSTFFLTTWIISLCLLATCLLSTEHSCSVPTVLSSSLDHHGGLDVGAQCYHCGSDRNNLSTLCWAFTLVLGASTEVLKYPKGRNARPLGVGTLGTKTPKQS